MDVQPLAERCQATWISMQRERTDAARELAERIASEFEATVSFHSHAGKQPTDDVLFGARFCGEGSASYWAGRAWEKAWHAGAGS